MTLTPALFRSLKADGADITKLRPSNWNAVVDLIARLLDGATTDGALLARDNSINGAGWTLSPSLTGLTVTNPITGSVTGNAATATLAASATILATGRAINGVTFNGSAAITVTAAAGTLSGATLASGVTASSLTSFGNSPTLVTPSLGVATATSLAFTTGPTFTPLSVATLALSNGASQTALRIYGNASTAFLNIGHDGSNAFVLNTAGAFFYGTGATITTVGAAKFSSNNGWTVSSNDIYQFAQTTDANDTTDAGLARTAVNEVTVTQGLSGAGHLRAASVRGVAVTVASLPSSPVEGMIVAVTDATATTAGSTVAGGSTHHVLVYYNGSNWVIVVGV